MAGYFAVVSDRRVLLYLDECSDFGVVADGTAVEINELGQCHVLSQSDVRANAYKVVFNSHSSSANSVVNTEETQAERLPAGNSEFFHEFVQAGPADFQFSG